MASEIFEKIFFLVPQSMNSLCSFQSHYDTNKAEQSTKIQERVQDFWKGIFV